MKKSIKGKRWSKNSPQKTVLNEILDDKEIIFLEKETKDTVNIQFSIKENQYAVYSEEYLPDTVAVIGHKKADITVFIFDEDAGKGKYYLVDVKSNIGGRDVIFHLCEQWKDGLKYLNHSVFPYLNEDFKAEEHLMIITRKFDVERIKRELESERKELQNIKENATKMLGAAKLYAQKAVMIKKECEILEKFIENRFFYQERSEKKEYLFEVGNLNKTETGSYLYYLFVEL